MTASGEELARRIDADRERLVELVRELVRIPSVNPKFETGDGLNREADVQRVIAERLRAAGMRVDVYEALPGRPNVVATRDGGAERSLAINGHVDVVPVGDRSTWSVDPFGAEVRDGRLYGRGSYDMKAGLAAAVAAATALHDAGVELAGRFEVHSVVDEEAGGFGTREAVARGQGVSAVISAEPTQGEVIVAEGGLEWVRVVLHGRNAHAGWRFNDIYPQRPGGDLPVPGVNAAELAARFIMAVRELERDWGRREAAHPLLPPGLNTINPGVVRVGSGVDGAGLPAVMSNPAMTPDLAVIDFDFKFVPGRRSADVRREFEDFVHHWAMQDTWLREHPPEVRWELGGLHFPPFDTPEDHPLVGAVRGARAALGRPARLGGFVAVADAAFYAGTGAGVVMHGHHGDAAHGADEWVDIDSIVDAAKTYALAALEYCGTR